MGRAWSNFSSGWESSRGWPGGLLPVWARSGMNGPAAPGFWSGGAPPFSTLSTAQMFRTWTTLSESGVSAGKPGSWNFSSENWMRFDSNLSKDSGLISIPMSILMVGGIILIVGFLTVMHRWQSHFARQMSLDRCVGQVTQEVRNSLRAVERSNQRMVELRVGIVAASVLPELRPPLEIALKGEALKQKLRMAEWRVNSARWRLVESCRLRHVRRSAYPEWPWIEEDPDLIGERPYKWNEQYQKRAEMQVGWKGLYSGAELYRHETNTWHSRWKNVLQTTPSGWADHD